jgi:DNA-binding FadR family transcriptional regulator
VPAETELVRTFGVFRATIREAMRRLEGDGLVVQRSGRRYIAGDARVPEMAFEQVANELRRVLEEGRYRRGSV